MFGQAAALALAGRHVSGVAYLHVPAAAAPAALLAFAYMSGGAGALNDLDKRRTTASESLGPVTELLARGINKLSGGHRYGTHNLLAPFAFAVGAWIAGYYRHDWPGQVFLGAYMAVILVSGLAFIRWKKNRRRAHAEYAAVAIAAGLAVFMAMTGRGLILVPAAVTVGAASHVVLDWFTDKGEHLAWPFSRHAFRCWLHFTTGEWFERVVVQSVLAVSLCCLILGVVLGVVGIHIPVAHLFQHLTGREL